MMSDAEGMALISKLKSDLRKDPKDWESWLHLAEALEKNTPQGWEEEAAASYEKVMQLAPDVAAGYLGFANILIDQFQDFEPAQAVLERACEAAPDDIAPLVSLGALRFHYLHDFKGAYDVFRKASSMEPSDLKLLEIMSAVAIQHLGRPEWVLADVERLLAMKPDDIDVLTLAGPAIADATGDMDRAAALFAHGAKKGEHDHHYWHNYGLFLLNHMGDAKGAKNALQRALLLDEECDSVNDDLAYLHAFQGDMDTAWTYVQKALMMADPDEDPGLVLVAHLNMLSGKMHGVGDSLTRALKNDPEDRVLLALMAKYMDFSGATDDDKAANKAALRKNLPSWEKVDDFIARTFNPLA